MGRLWLAALSKSRKGNQDWEQSHRQIKRSMPTAVVQKGVSSWHGQLGKGTTGVSRGVESFQMRTPCSTSYPGSWVEAWKKHHRHRYVVPELMGYRRNGTRCL